VPTPPSPGKGQPLTLGIDQARRSRSAPAPRRPRGQVAPIRRATAERNAASGAADTHMRRAGWHLLRGLDLGRSSRDALPRRCHRWNLLIRVRPEFHVIPGHVLPANVLVSASRPSRRPGCPRTGDAGKEASNAASQDFVAHAVGGRCGPSHLMFE